MKRSLFIASMMIAIGCETPPPPAQPLDAIDHGGDTGPIVFILHGYGSRPEDLVSFTERTDLPPGSRFVLPYAPERADPGFAWFQLPMDLRGLRDRRTELGAVRARLGALIDSVQTRSRPRPLVLMGFSQGAMMALDFALHDPRPLAGLVLLSSTLIDERTTRARVASRRGLRVYVSHGRSDDLLPYSEHEALVRLLREGGMDVEVRTFDGGHVVTPEVSSDAAAFIRDVARD